MGHWHIPFERVLGNMLDDVVRSSNGSHALVLERRCHHVLLVMIDLRIVEFRLVQPVHPFLMMLLHVPYASIDLELTALKLLTCKLYLSLGLHRLSPHSWGHQLPLAELLRNVSGKIGRLHANLWVVSVVDTEVRAFVCQASNLLVASSAFELRHRIDVAFPWLQPSIFQRSVNLVDTRMPIFCRMPLSTLIPRFHYSSRLPESVGL
mmetsp:Transcript_15241/g.30889  ORF Transcript_15241/g.30889 Transcript_15241/m.30889 type:complete len:207 (+) Transcript_15241:712-1332(+)